MKEEYPLINSVLGGIYGANIGYSEEEALVQLEKDLEQKTFKENIKKELKLAFNNADISWKKLLDQNEVMYVETEEEAKVIVKKYLWEAVFNEKT